MPPPYLFIFVLIIPRATPLLHPMKIATISGYGALPTAMQSELQRALKWFENAFLVEKLSFSVKIQNVTDRIPEYQKFTTVFVQTPEKRVNIGFKSQNMQKLLDFADFLVFVVAKDPKECESDPNLLAEALPLGFWADTRPPLATMSICPRDSPNLPLYDLFRHEILHGMGYGLIIDKTKKSHKPSENYKWKTPRGTQMAVRHYLDFDDLALKSVKSHFNCDNLMGVEADGPRKHHLNEYVFGNELMTSDLESSGNIFSWISMGIIERTFNGKRQWYHVNRTFIHPEASQYSFGKHFGCEFLQKSCWEFIESTEKKNPNLKIGQFCTKNHKNMCYLFDSKHVRITDKDCDAPRHHFYQTPTRDADNGVKKIPELPYSNLAMRFCPVVTYSHLLPNNYRIGPCPSGI